METSKQLQPIKVLLVEDDEADVELIRETLLDSKISLKLDIVNDGVDAMRYLSQKDKFSDAMLPDIVILDLNLPRKDGREVIIEMKSEPHLMNIPVVVLTTSDAETDIVRMYDAGVNCYVTKPFGLEQFQNVVKAVEKFWMTVVKLPEMK